MPSADCRDVGISGGTQPVLSDLLDLVSKLGSISAIATGMLVAEIKNLRGEGQDPKGRKGGVGAASRRKRVVAPAMSMPMPMQMFGFGSRDLMLLFLYHFSAVV